MRSYYRSRGGVVTGPFDVGSLMALWKAGDVLTTDLYCEAGGSVWREGSAFVEELWAAGGSMALAIRPTMAPALPQRAERSVDPLHAMAAIQMHKKSPGVACLLSFLLPGAGHFYLGQIGLGVALLVGAIVLGILLCGFGYFIVGVLAMALAANAAQEENRRLAADLGLSGAVYAGAPQPAGGAKSGGWWVPVGGAVALVLFVALVYTSGRARLASDAKANPTDEFYISAAKDYLTAHLNYPEIREDYWWVIALQDGELKRVSCWVHANGARQRWYLDMDTRGEVRTADHGDFEQELRAGR